MSTFADEILPETGATEAQINARLHALDTWFRRFVSGIAQTSPPKAAQITFMDDAAKIINNDYLEVKRGLTRHCTGLLRRR